MSRSDRRGDAGLIEERRRNPPLQRVPPIVLRDPPYSGMWHVKRAVKTVVVVLVLVGALTCLVLAMRGIA